MTSEQRPDDLLDELAIVCRQLAAEGHEDGNFAHLAARDPAGRGLWLKRSGIGLGEVDGPDDFVLLDFDGNQLAGSGGRHYEWPIHAEIMRTRPDIVATCHTHELGIRLFASTSVPFQQLIPDSTAFVGGLPRFTETSGLIRTPELGQQLSRALGDRPAVLMANHGAAVAGRSVPQVGVMVMALTRAIGAQLVMASTGWPVSEADAGDADEKGRFAYSLEMTENHWSFYRRRDGRQRAL
jgi:L-fuculose-phosphate aldolase